MTFEDRHKSKRKNQENFFIFMLRASVRSGARITVVVVPEGDSERIVACTIWRPPHKDVPLSNIVFLVRCGIVQVLLGWGFSLFKVLFFDLHSSPSLSNLYQRISAVVQPTDATLVEGYKEMGLEGTPEDSWYLQLAGTDPEFQNKGMGKMTRGSPTLRWHYRLHGNANARGIQAHAIRRVHIRGFHARIQR